MVRAILEGSKTQTRRVVKGHVNERPSDWSATRYASLDDHKHVWTLEVEGAEQVRVACPYGQPGDRLWVRETWCCAHSTDDKPSPNDLVHYRADKSKAGDVITDVRSWSPSIHMPRAYSRITLEVTGVRVERLHDITDYDAYAEGADVWIDDYLDKKYGKGGGSKFSNIRHAYRALWESINGPGSWDTNPWVWVVEFRRVV